MAGSEIDLALSQINLGAKPDPELNETFVVSPDEPKIIKEHYSAKYDPAFNQGEVKPILMLHKKLYEVMDTKDHGLVDKIIKTLPQSLHEPAAIFLSNKHGKHGEQGIVLLTDKETVSGGMKVPLVVAIHVDKAGKIHRKNALDQSYQTNEGGHLLASAYGKDKAKQTMQHWVNDGRLIYTNPVKIETLETYGIKLINQDQGLNINRETEGKTHQDLSQDGLKKGKDKGIEF